MAKVRIEPTGCVIKRGLIQVRYDFYLEPDDYNYDLMWIDEPIIPPGTIWPSAKATDEEKKTFYDWIDTLPTQRVNAAFHGYLAYFPPDVTDQEIKDTGETLLHEAYAKWAAGEWYFNQCGGREMAKQGLKYPDTFTVNQEILDFLSEDPSAFEAKNPELKEYINTYPDIVNKVAGWENRVAQVRQLTWEISTNGGH